MEINFCHYDTLFLVNGRGDSLAGHRPTSRHVQANPSTLQFEFVFNSCGSVLGFRKFTIEVQFSEV